MLEPFLLRSIAAAVGLAIIAAPLGCVVVWNRMAYFGETIAQACLIGVALGLALEIEPTSTVFGVAVAAAFAILALGRQNFLPLDSILGLMHHGTLSAGVIASVAIAGPSLDLMAYLFGDLYAVTTSDLYVIFVGGTVVLFAIGYLWQSLLRLVVHEQLAEAEGVHPMKVRAGFTLLLAIFVAAAIKIVGILLVIAFLVVPAIAARPFATTPERMVIITAIAGLIAVALGFGLSLQFDTPGGPAIVLMMALLAVLSLIVGQVRQRRTQ
ncbi:MAG: metal ABC transporter permease [Hyphomicrobiaceae bacterium]